MPLVPAEPGAPPGTHEPGAHASGDKTVEHNAPHHGGSHDPARSKRAATPTKKWESAKLRIEVVYQALTSIAIIVAACWALYTYMLQREGVWNLTMSVSSETAPFNGSKRLVILHVDLYNNGRLAIRPSEPGLQLRVIKVPRIITDTELLVRAGSQIPGGDEIVHGYNMLSHYGRAQDDPNMMRYQIEPGAKYQETEAIVADAGDILLVSLQFYGPDGDSITQYKYVTVSAAEGQPAADGAKP